MKYCIATGLKVRLQEIPGALWGRHAAKNEDNKAKQRHEAFVMGLDVHKWYQSLRRILYEPLTSPLASRTGEKVSFCPWLLW